MSIYKKTADEVATDMVNVIKSNCLPNRIVRAKIALTWEELHALLSQAFQAGCRTVEKATQE